MNKIFWVGDSTVQYNDYTTYPQTGIGQVFGLFCRPEWEIRNLAKNGQSSKSFWNGGLFDRALKEMSEGDYLFIQFGHNDEKIKPDGYTDPLTTYHDYLMKYVVAAKKAAAIPVLITPVARRHFMEDGKLEDSHRGYPGVMKKLAEQEHIMLVDLCESSKQLIEESGELKSREWFMYFPAGCYEHYKVGLKDNTHLRYTGAVRMAELIARQLMSCTEMIIKYEE